jgi:hypothetical protein
LKLQQEQAMSRNTAKHEKKWTIAMSNQNDLDDQLYILLASMKEYREAIADDNKRLETFYNKVASGVLEQSKRP